MALLPTATLADVEEAASATWALEHGFDAGSYALASSGTEGAFLICFRSGNVRAVTVSAGPESSVIIRGSCTVFSARDDAGISVDFFDAPSDLSGHSIALGTFRMVVAAEN